MYRSRGVEPETPPVDMAALRRRGTGVPLTCEGPEKRSGECDARCVEPDRGVRWADDRGVGLALRDDALPVDLARRVERVDRAETATCEVPRAVPARRSFTCGSCGASTLPICAAAPDGMGSPVRVFALTFRMERARLLGSFSFWD